MRVVSSEGACVNPGFKCIGGMLVGAAVDGPVSGPGDCGGCVALYEGTAMATTTATAIAAKIRYLKYGRSEK